MSNKTNRTNKKNNATKLKSSKQLSVASKVLVKNLQEILMIMLLAVAAFLLIAFTSYHPFDAGWSRTAQHVTTHNLAGSFGAWGADLLLYFFGLSAYLFPISLIYIWISAWFTKTHSSLSMWGVKLLGFVLTLLATAGIIALLPHNTKLLINVTMPISMGGIVGDFIGNYLYRQASLWGAGLILCYCLLAGLTAMIGISWLNLLKLGYLIAIKILSCSSKIILKSYKFGIWLLLRCAGSLINFQKKHGAVLKAKNINPARIPVGVQAITVAGFAVSWIRRSLKQLILNIQELWRKKYTPNTREDCDNTQPKKTIDNTPTTVSRQRQAARDFVKKIQTNNPKIHQAVVSTPKAAKHVNQANNALPGLDLLEKTDPQDLKYARESLPDPSNIQAKLADFGIACNIVEIFPGPVVTRVEMELAPGTKASKVTTLSKDLARSLSVPSVRVVEVIPGKTVVGLEIPNNHRALVRLREILAAEQYTLSGSSLTLALGKDIAGVPVVADLTRMPHLLVAGTTGSGKSVGVNAMLLSILYKASVDDVRLILIDPKMLELSIYDGIPHLLTPVVTDMKDAANALNWCVFEMERRYKLMASLGVRNLLSFNLKIQAAINNRNPMFNPLYNSALPESINNKQYLEKLPYIVVIIDEFADMMMVVGKKVEEQISRIAQKARAAGIHMILATQRPSVDVITGLIKANIPTRIAFQVSSRIDSRTILDQQGAEQLLGHGDLLYLPPGSGIPLRVHGAFVTDEEVHRVVSYLKTLTLPASIDQVNLIDSELTDPILLGSDLDSDLDPLYDQAVAIVTSSRKASISYLQRRLKIGFNRAARLMEELQAQQVISTQHNGIREVLAPPPPEHSKT